MCNPYIPEETSKAVKEVIDSLTIEEKNTLLEIGLILIHRYNTKTLFDPKTTHQTGALYKINDCLNELCSAKFTPELYDKLEKLT